MTVTPEARRGPESTGHAVEQLYRDHAAEVYRYAYGVLGNRADAEDMTQSTFVNALRAMERGERPRKPSHWLITIAHNLARERFRRAQARPTEVALDIDSTAAEGPTENAVSMAELTSALARIPASQRSALVLREFEGRSYADIASRLGISTGALETLLFRARRSLSEELEAAVTCETVRRIRTEGAARALGRKEQRRLDLHIRECPGCRRTYGRLGAARRGIGTLLWLPLVPGKLFRGAHSPVATTAGGSGAPLAAGTGAGLAAGGTLTAKVAAILVSATVAGGIGYTEGHHALRSSTQPSPRPTQLPPLQHPAGSETAAAARIAGQTPGQAQELTQHAVGTRTPTGSDTAHGSWNRPISSRAAGATSHGSATASTRRLSPRIAGQKAARLTPHGASAARSSGIQPAAPEPPVRRPTSLARNDPSAAATGKGSTFGSNGSNPHSTR